MSEKGGSLRALASAGGAGVFLTIRAWARFKGWDS